jgi:hypothetical protein
VTGTGNNTIFPKTSPVLSASSVPLHALHQFPSAPSLILPHWAFYHVLGFKEFQFWTQAGRPSHSHVPCPRCGDEIVAAIYRSGSRQASFLQMLQLLREEIFALLAHIRFSFL